MLYYRIPSSIIKKNSTERAYMKGIKMYRQGFVEEVDFEDFNDDTVAIKTNVLSSERDRKYEVYVEYDIDRRKLSDSWCDCQAFPESFGLCKHCVAAILKFNAMLEDTDDVPVFDSNGDRATSKVLKNVMYEKPMEQLQKFQEMSQHQLPASVELIPILSQEFQRQWSVSFRIGTPAHYYVLKDLSNFVRALQYEEHVHYGKKLEFVHNREAFAPKSLPLLDLIVETITMEWTIRNSVYRYYNVNETKRDLLLTTTNLFRLLHLCTDGKILFATEKREEIPFLISEQEKLELPISLKPDTDGYELLVPSVEILRDGRHTCLVMPGEFIFCSQELADGVEALSQLSSRTELMRYFIAEADMKAFCATLLPKLMACSDLDTTGLEQYLPDPCQLSVYFDDDGMNILCRAEAKYGQQTFLLYGNGSNEDFLRDWAQEYELRALLNQYFPNCDANGELFFSRDDDERLYQLLTRGVDQILTLAEVYLSDRMKRIQVQPQPALQVGVSIKGGLLDLDIESERLPQKELQGLLDSYQKRRKYYRMKNGDFLQLEDGPLATLAELAHGLELSGYDLQQGHLQIPQYNAYYIDQVLREGGESLTVQRDMNFRSLIRNLKNYEDSDDDVPTGLQTALRPYQQIGYQWMMTLTRMGLGGILADDMGLGKTVQVITVLLANQEKLFGKPALIVTPASLVYNWESELQRFAPSLTVQAITGTAAERKKLLKAQSAQVLLTSYDLLKRDVDHYEGFQFSFLVIDEAQNIKNHTTKAAKAVKTLPADNRFALTGTPIENRLSELWSIFDFLLPGMLGRYEDFRQQYETAIVQQQDELALKRLQKKIQPFILRRLKKDVLKDLPDKIENIVYSKMDAPQRTLYVANLQRILDSLSGKTEAEVHSEKLQILAELTRLRQLCCDPSLLYENYQDGSAKLDTCMELLDGAVQSDSKVLVFSQFTTMLDRIRQRLDKKEIVSYTLTGATSKEKRAELVKRFNETDEASVFLISLKAGGTGLNLTAASVVIHVDPWWNAAVQEQATDRAHRIGQKQTVTVFKLITKDTIEEKIQLLQESKLALSDSVISAQGVSVASLSKDEIIDILQN